MPKIDHESIQGQALVKYALFPALMAIGIAASALAVQAGVSRLLVLNIVTFVFFFGILALMISVVSD